MKTYFLGYVVGTTIAGTEALMQDMSKEPDECGERPTMVFETRGLAVQAAQREGAWQYTRGYAYHTDNPDNAKDLLPIEDVEDTCIKPLPFFTEALRAAKKEEDEKLDAAIRNLIEQEGLE